MSLILRDQFDASCRFSRFTSTVKMNVIHQHHQTNHLHCQHAHSRADHCPVTGRSIVTNMGGSTRMAQGSNDLATSLSTS